MNSDKESTPDDSDRSLYRILDANANRAGEGLRTLEEFARFVLDDAGKTEQLKSLRHSLVQSLSGIDREHLLSARDTSGDVGTEISVTSEVHRTGLASVIAAASSRVTQSLRVLEEYSKPIDPRASQQIEQIRYRCYTVCAELETASHRVSRLQRLADAQLYVLIDAGSSDEDFANSVKTLSTAGVDILQLRDAQQDDRTLYRRACIGVEITSNFDTLFIVNDRADIAIASRADGVHIGQEELPPKAAREIVGTARLVGVSTHDLHQVHTAIADGADYIGCGPVFPGNTKAFDEFAGAEFLKATHDEPKERSLPAFAIGGINIDNLSQVIATGFHRVAVTGAIRDAEDPAMASAKLKSLLLEQKP